MPYAKSSTGYPPEFFDILDRVAEGSTVTMECESASQARGKRAQWYQFLGALKRDVSRPPAWMNTPQEKTKLLDRTRAAMATELTLEGATLLFRNRILRGVRITVEAASGVEVPSTKQEDSIAKLLEIQKEVKGEKNEGS